MASQRFEVHPIDGNLQRGYVNRIQLVVRGVHVHHIHQSQRTLIPVTRFRAGHSLQQQLVVPQCLQVDLRSHLGLTPGGYIVVF